MWNVLCVRTSDVDVYRTVGGTVETEVDVRHLSALETLLWGGQ